VCDRCTVLCIQKRDRECMCVHVCVCVRACVRVCVYVCKRGPYPKIAEEDVCMGTKVYLWERVCVQKRERERERERETDRQRKKEREREGSEGSVNYELKHAFFI